MSGAEPRNEVPPHERAALLVARSQLVLLASLVLCTAVMPRFLFSTDMGGVSNYGTHAATVVPYTVGGVAAVWLLWRAATVLGAVPDARAVVTVTRVACCCMVANLSTTFAYRSGPVWATVHSWTAITLALAEFVGGVLLLRRVPTPIWRVGGATLVVVGFTCLVLTYVGLLHVLFVAEVTTAAGFGLALIGAVRSLALRSGTAAAPTSRRG